MGVKTNLLLKHDLADVLEELEGILRGCFKGGASCQGRNFISYRTRARRTEKGRLVLLFSPGSELTGKEFKGLNSFIKDYLAVYGFKEVKLYINLYELIMGQGEHRAAISFEIVFSIPGGYSPELRAGEKEKYSDDLSAVGAGDLLDPYLGRYHGEAAYTGGGFLGAAGCCRC